MPDCCNERIVAAFAARLATIAGVAGLTVARDRNAPPEIGELPILIVYDNAPDETGTVTGERGFTLAIDVEGHVTAPADADASAAVNNLRAKVDSVLFADVTLGGLATNLQSAAEAAPVRNFLDGADPTKSFARSFEIDYATLEADLFTFA